LLDDGRIRIRGGKIRIRDKHPGSTTLTVKKYAVQLKEQEYGK
jgi:hypothetical protein